MKGLAVTSKDRVKSLPNVPTARELGLGEADDTTWVVFFVPAKTPDAVIQKINADVNAILKDKDTAGPARQDRLHGGRRLGEGGRGLCAVGNASAGATSSRRSVWKRSKDREFNAGSPRRHRSQEGRQGHRPDRRDLEGCGEAARGLHLLQHLVDGAARRQQRRRRWRQEDHRHRDEGPRGVPRDRICAGRRRRAITAPIRSTSRW